MSYSLRSIILSLFLVSAPLALGEERIHRDPPYFGGSAQDPAPPSQGQTPQAGHPPDPTKPGADKADTPPAPPANTRRSSNLPMAAIVAAVGAGIPIAQVDPKINNQIGPGNFVSNFLAYHVVWYREWWATQNPKPAETCLYSGHTHVGGQVSVGNAERAVEIQLEELFRVLP